MNPTYIELEKIVSLEEYEEFEKELHELLTNPTTKTIYIRLFQDKDYTKEASYKTYKAVRVKLTDEYWNKKEGMCYNKVEITYPQCISNEGQIMKSFCFSKKEKGEVLFGSELTKALYVNKYIQPHFKPFDLSIDNKSFSKL